MAIRQLCCTIGIVLLCCHWAAAQPLELPPTAAGCWAHLEEELLLWVKPAEQFSLSSDAVVQVRLGDGLWEDVDQWSHMGDGLWHSLEIRWQVPYVQPGMAELVVDAVFATPAALIRRGGGNDRVLALGDPVFTWENGEVITGGTWHAVSSGQSIIFAEQRIWPQASESVAEQAAADTPKSTALKFVGPRTVLTPGQTTALEILLPKGSAGREVTVQWPVSLRQDGDWTMDGSVVAYDPAGRQLVTVHVPANGGLLRSAFHVLLHPGNGSGQFVVTMDGETHVLKPQWRDMGIPQAALVLSDGHRHALAPGLHAFSQDHAVRWLWLEPLTAQSLPGEARKTATWMTVDVGSGGTRAQAAVDGGGLRWNGATLRLHWIHKQVGQSLVLNAQEQRWQLRGHVPAESWTLGDWRWSGSGQHWSGVLERSQWQVRVDLPDNPHEPLGTVHWLQDELSLSYTPNKASVKASMGGVTGSWSPSQRNLKFTGEAMRLEWRAKPSGWQTALDLNTELGVFEAAFGVDTANWLRAGFSKEALQISGHWRAGMTTLSLVTAHQGKRLQRSVGRLLTWDGEVAAAFSRWRWQYEGHRISLRWGPDFHWAANQWSWDAVVGCIWEPMPGLAVYSEYHTRRGWTWQVGWAQTIIF